MNPFEQYGLAPTFPGSAGGGSAMAAATQADRNTAPPWHPDNPLFWFGALLGLTAGFIAGGSNLRVGPVKASVSAGKKKS